ANPEASVYFLLFTPGAQDALESFVVRVVSMRDSLRMTAGTLSVRFSPNGWQVQVSDSRV
ncbi:MAG: hypothetical protein ACREOH_23900, partial [Candidatus Entotheonellia bacterium]